MRATVNTYAEAMEACVRKTNATMKAVQEQTKAEIKPGLEVMKVTVLYFSILLHCIIQWVLQVMLLSVCSFIVDVRCHCFTFSCHCDTVQRHAVGAL
jgi:hypothetical protein